MGKRMPEPRARKTIGGSMPLMSVSLLTGWLLAGCAHQDVVDTPVGWFHQLQGGAIAQQRPPPPGVNDPYPRIGTTPAHAPVVASLDLRRSVTGALLNQRNLTNRLDANDPIAPPVAPPHPAAPQPPPPAGSAGASSATLDAAQTTAPAASAKPAAPAPAASPTPAAPAGPAAAGATDSEPELAMPAVQVQAADAPGGVVTMPEIPGAPPVGPHLPGLATRVGMPAQDRKLPDYRTAPITGTQIDFLSGTDSMVSGQIGTLHALAARRGDGTLVVHGYGDAAGTDADTQTQALSVAALRARAVAEALQSEGVPAKSILLRAAAFGRGASVSLVN